VLRKKKFETLSRIYIYSRQYILKKYVSSEQLSRGKAFPSLVTNTEYMTHGWEHSLQGLRFRCLSVIWIRKTFR